MSTEHTIAEQHTIVEGVKNQSSNHPARPHFIAGYAITEQLPAGGGESDIFLAQKDDICYAVKLYRFGYEPKTGVIKTLQELSGKHPDRIVRIIEFGFDADISRWYEVQEYAEYGSLKDFIYKNRYFGKQELIHNIITETFKSLSVLHENNILHLDLKPSNILIKDLFPSLDLVLTDFGISSAIDPDISKKMTTVKGTPLYWAPESFTGIVSKASDYWSLGIMVLEFFLGRHPFKGIDTNVIMYRLSTKGVEVPDTIPDKYAVLLKGLLTRNPDKRWKMGELKRWLDGDTTIAVHYDYAVSDGAYREPYSLFGEKYYSKEKLLASCIKDPDSWQTAVSHFKSGFFSDWLKQNGDFEESLFAAKIAEKAPDTDSMIVRLYTRYLRLTGFVFRGKLITVKNLSLFYQRILKNEATDTENIIAASCENGKLCAEYLVFIEGKQAEKDELFYILDLLKGKTIEQGFRICDFMIAPNRYHMPLPEDKKLLFVQSYFQFIISKKESDYLINHCPIPAEARENIGSTHIQKFLRAAETFCFVLKHRDILSFRALERFTLPSELSEDLSDECIERFMKAAKKTIELFQDKIICKTVDIPEQYRPVFEKTHSVDDYLHVIQLMKMNVSIPLYNQIFLTLQNIYEMEQKTQACTDIIDYLRKMRNAETEWLTTDRDIISRTIFSLQQNDENFWKWPAIFGAVFFVLGIYISLFFNEDLVRLTGSLAGAMLTFYGFRTVMYYYDIDYPNHWGFLRIAIQGGEIFSAAIVLIAILGIMESSGSYIPLTILMVTAAGTVRGMLQYYKSPGKQKRLENVYRSFSARIRTVNKITDDAHPEYTGTIDENIRLVLKEFEQNPAAAMRKYSKDCIIRGAMSQVNYEDEKLFVDISRTTGNLRTIRIFLTPSEHKKAADLKFGNFIAIQCTGVSFSDSIPVFENGVIKNVIGME